MLNGLDSFAKEHLATHLHVNDVVINHLGEGRLLRTDGIHLGRDAQVRGGTVGSGCIRCKADLRYDGSAGASLKVNGNILSLDGMHNGHHVEILHLAPENHTADWIGTVHALENLAPSEPGCFESKPEPKSAERDNCSTIYS